MQIAVNVDRLSKRLDTVDYRNVDIYDRDRLLNRVDIVLFS